MAQAVATMPDVLTDDEMTSLEQKHMPDALTDAQMSALEASHAAAEKPYNPNTPFGPEVKTAKDLGKRVAGEFSDVNAPGANKPIAGFPEYAARVAGGVVSSAADIVQAPLNLIANQPLQNPKDPNETIGDWVQHGAQKVGEAYAKTLVYDALAKAGTALANTQTGKNVYNWAQQPGVQADLKSVAQVANAVSTFGVPGVAKVAEAATIGSAGRLAEGAANLGKSGISQLSGIERPLLEKASNRAYLRELRKAGVSAKEGGIDNLVDRLHRQIRSENANTRQGAISKIDQVNEALDKTINQNTEQAQAQLDKAVNTVPRPKSDIGASIELSHKQATSGAGERFGEQQDAYLPRGVESEALRPTAISSRIDNILKEAGHDESQGYRMVEAFDNSPATESDIKDALKFRDLSTHANNTGDLLTQLRTIRKLKGAQKEGGGFYNSVMMGKIDGAYQSAIEEQLTNTNPKFADLWRANNAQYKESMDALGNIRKSLSLGRVNPEQYADKIKNIGSQDLLKLKGMAAKDKNLAPLWSDLKNGFIENLALKSMDKEGNLSAESLAKAWAEIDKSDSKLKSTILGSYRLKAIDNALKNYQDVVAKNTDLAESAKLTTKTIDKISRGSKIGEDLLGTSSLTKVANIGSQAAASKEALAQLKTIDAFYGTNYAEEAMKFYEAKVLGINERGKLPIITDIKTGRSLLGPVIGRIVGSVPLVGESTGAALGILGQSPAGAIAAYKALNVLEKTGKYLQGGSRAAALSAEEEKAAQAVVPQEAGPNAELRQEEKGKDVRPSEPSVKKPFSILDEVKDKPKAAEQPKPETEAPKAEPETKPEPEAKTVSEEAADYVKKTDVKGGSFNSHFTKWFKALKAEATVAGTVAFNRAEAYKAFKKAFKEKREQAGQ